MKPIFKKTTGAPAATDIVADYNFKAFYPEVNRNMAWAELEPYITLATRRFVLPFLGREFYDEVADLIEAGDPLENGMEDFVELLRFAIAYHTISIALPVKKTVIASMGAVENQAGEGTTTSTQWGFRTTLWAVAQSADRAMDDLLAFLETEVTNANTAFDTWKDSDAYSFGKSDFFRHTKDFQEFQNINSSRRSFIAMLPTIKQCARQYIAPVISQEQYDDLVAKVKAAAELEAADKKLLENVRAALAAWTVYQASNKLAILPDQDGWRVISNADAIDTRSYSAEVTKAAIQAIRDGAEQDARTNTADLMAFMYENKADYELYSASSSNPDNEKSYFIPPIGSEYGAVML